MPRNPFESAASSSEQEPSLVASTSIRSKYWKELKSVSEEEKFSEDTVLCQTENGTFGVFDGVGGEDGGGIASKTMAQFLQAESKQWKNLPAEQVAQKMKESIARAHARLLEIGEENFRASNNAGMRHMATTCCLAQIIQNGNESRLLVANIGDSKAYLLRKHEPMRPLTTEQNAFLGYGAKTPPPAEIIDIPLKEGDSILLTSDGLLKNLSEESIQGIIEQARRTGKDPAPLLTNPEHIHRIQKAYHSRGKHRPVMDAEPNENNQAVLKNDDLSVVLVNIGPHISPSAETSKKAIPAPTPDTRHSKQELQKMLSAFVQNQSNLHKKISQLNASPEWISKEIALRQAFDDLTLNDPYLNLITSLARDKDLIRGTQLLMAFAFSLRSHPEPEKTAHIRTHLAPVIRKIQQLL